MRLNAGLDYLIEPNEMLLAQDHLWCPYNCRGNGNCLDNGSCQCVWDYMGKSCGYEVLDLEPNGAQSLQSAIIYSGRFAFFRVNQTFLNSSSAFSFVVTRGETNEGVTNTISSYILTANNGDTQILPSKDFSEHEFEFSQFKEILKPWKNVTGFTTNQFDMMYIGLLNDNNFVVEVQIEFFQEDVNTSGNKKLKNIIYISIIIIAILAIIIFMFEIFSKSKRTEQIQVLRKLVKRQTTLGGMKLGGRRVMLPEWKPDESDAGDSKKNFRVGRSPKKSKTMFSPSKSRFENNSPVRQRVTKIVNNFSLLGR